MPDTPIADRIVQAASTAIHDDLVAEFDLTDWDISIVARAAAEAAIRMLAECAWFDPNVLHLTPADLYDLVRQIEQQGGRE